MRPDITGPNSKSQYSGTLKKTIYNNCDTDLTNMNREQQDKHGEKCKMQEKLF